MREVIIGTLRFNALIKGRLRHVTLLEQSEPVLAGEILRVRLRDQEDVFMDTLITFAERSHGSEDYIVSISKNMGWDDG